MYDLPRLMLGTSPFIGAGQFGSKSMDYRRVFFENPDNMTLASDQFHPSSKRCLESSIVSLLSLVITGVMVCVYALYKNKSQALLS